MCIWTHAKGPSHLWLFKRINGSELASHFYIKDHFTGINEPHCLWLQSSLSTHHPPPPFHPTSIPPPPPPPTSIYVRFCLLPLNWWCRGLVPLTLFFWSFYTLLVGLSALASFSGSVQSVGAAVAARVALCLLQVESSSAAPRRGAASCTSGTASWRWTEWTSPTCTMRTSSTSSRNRDIPSSSPSGLLSVSRCWSCVMFCAVGLNCFRPCCRGCVVFCSVGLFSVWHPVWVAAVVWCVVQYHAH